MQIVDLFEHSTDFHCIHDSICIQQANMKPPRLPGTEKFRFCDKKFDLQSQKQEFLLKCNENKQIETVFDAPVKTSLIITLSHSISTESLSSTVFDEKNKLEPIDKISTSPSFELINQNNPLIVRNERNKRKPNIPISSKLTSRVFTLTSYFRPTEEDTHNYCIDDFTCDTRSPTPISINSGEESNRKSLQDAHTRSCHCSPSCPHMNMIINSTSQASLLSNSSLPSLSGPPNELDDNSRSSSGSPIDHWAKNPINRHSIFSQTSWDDCTHINEIT